MRKCILLVWLALSWLLCQGQWITSSNLPIIIINTDINPNTGSPYSIPDEPKVGAHMRILYVNDTTDNYLSNQNDSAFLNYDGRIAIELRGSTSQGHNKKPYGFETRMADDVTNNNVSLLGFPAENDWVLTPMNDEPSFVRDGLSYRLAREMGHYAPRTKYCEVIVNDDYRGLYFLTEKIKIDDDRVDILKMDTTDNGFPNVTGGYIVKADKTTGGDVPAWSTPAYGYGENVDYIYHDPKPENITTLQGAYIQLYFDTIRYLTSIQNQDVSNGFPAYLDIPSFVDYMILGEFSSNVDIYQKSTFFHKDRNGKFRAGPVWDFNLAYGYDFGSVGRSRYDVFQFANGDNTGSYFWHQLYENEMFKCMLVRRWQSLCAEGPLSSAHVESVIDSLKNRISSAFLRERLRWNRWYDYDAHIETMKTWIQNRRNWLSEQWESSDVCVPDQLPPLVISKIHYHPAIWNGYESNQLEFIGITNHGDDTVDVSGVYFMKLGLTYAFPENSRIAPHKEIFLASNAQAFEQRYNFPPYGEYTRHLSNKSQELVLSDAWGNIIDEVTYRDTLPWPMSADGRGDFLVLADLDSDNSLGENWTTGSVLVGCPEYAQREGFLQVSPNPAADFVRVETTLPVSNYRVMDINGRILLVGEMTGDVLQLDVSSLHSGMYFIEVFRQDHSTSVAKFVKK